MSDSDSGGVSSLAGSGDSASHHSRHEIPACELTSSSASPFQCKTPRRQLTAIQYMRSPSPQYAPRVVSDSSLGCHRVASYVSSGSAWECKR